ncbi:glycoside hydrolase family 5 protein [Candidatus Dojkabacteria bacterium]|jgi:glucan 1,3-beta-glucosidase|nr:glycoside hydrolase family 5 protein [Candidatus Dojkabacteria bacterium]
MSQELNSKFNKKVRGVNLGGWLVLEKWMTPSLFDGLQATDETTWCVEMGKDADARLKKHWDTFITQDDFKWLSERGINTVRIPVGFWIFGAYYPYHPKYGENQHPFVKGGIKVLDKVFEWAENYGINVVLDLHCGPGCQNGFDNGGLLGIFEWHTKEEYINHALWVLEHLAERYHNSPALYAIETLNEPRWDIPTELLKEYHTNAYHLIRHYCKPEDVAIVYSDGFRPYSQYNGFLSEPEFENVVMDIHRYQCFSRRVQDLDIYGHVCESVIDWKTEADNTIKDGHRVYLGEWSLGLDLKVVSVWAAGPYNYATEHMDALQMDVAYRAYASTQLITFEKYDGWFFWSYKTETTPAWCFRECVERGWLPNQFDNSKIDTTHYRKPEEI